MYRLKMALICVIVAGCGGDPENGRLETGDKVIAFEHESHDGTKYDRVYVRDTGYSLIVAIPFGTHLSVVKDDEGVSEGRTWSSRAVLVHIEEGEHKSRTGKVARWSLRKVK